VLEQVPDVMRCEISQQLLALRGHRDQHAAAIGGRSLPLGQPGADQPADQLNRG